MLPYIAYMDPMGYGLLRIIMNYYGHTTAMPQTIIPGITIHIWLVNPSEKY